MVEHVQTTILIHVHSSGCLNLQRRKLNWKIRFEEGICADYLDDFGVIIRDGRFDQLAKKENTGEAGTAQ